MSASARIWILVGILFVVHFLLHVGMGIGRAAPDLLTVGLLVASREIEIGWAAGTGFVFGLMEDALSMLAFGANTVAMTTLGILGAFSRDFFVGDSRLFLISYFVMGKWIRDFVHWIAVGEDLRQSFLDQVIFQGMIGGLYAAAVGVTLLAVIGLAGEA